MFDLSSIPAGSTINSAVFTVSSFSESDGYIHQDFNLQRCTDNTWTESALTWNNAPNASVLAPVLATYTTTSNSNTLTFTITSAVSAALASGKLSLRLIDSAEGSGVTIAMTSKEYAATHANTAPNLLVNYTAPASSTNFFMMF